MISPHAPDRRAGPPSRRLGASRGRRRWIVAIAALLAIAFAPDLGAGPADHTGSAIAPSERAELQRLYGTGSSPLWLDAAGSPTADAVDALALLASAGADGLDAADYQVADRAPGAAFDVALSAAVLRYLRHLHLGRVDPRRLGVGLTVEHQRHDFVRILQEALAAHDLPARAAALAPQLAQYGALRQQLAAFRRMPDVPVDGWPPARPTLHLGDRHTGLTRVRQRLRDLGDLAGTPGADHGGERYDADLEAAIRRFQRRHGLAEDGALGRATLAALASPSSRRIRQIELALERLRWLPDATGDRVIVLNIPMFRLWAAGGAEAADPGPTMRVIVGRAVKTETPVFVAELREVVFRPYWNVPTSILRQELLPALARDPRQIDRRDFEVVPAGGGSTVVPPGPEALAGLRDGSLRLRQRPGPRNALGLVKFVFPNDASVYLHGTPEPTLFSRSRRDFSHGCIRVEAPDRLADWVLRSEPGWTRERIAEAMDAGPDAQTVRLSRPIRVVLFYTTAAVMPDDGTIHFADDIYRHDARLDAALRARPSPRQGR